MFDIKIMLVLACLAFAVSAVEAGSAKLPLVPWPRKVNILAGLYRPRMDLLIKSAGTDMPAADRVARTLAHDLRDLGFSPSVTAMTEGKAHITLSVTDDLSFGDEGYRLMVGETITIVAATSDGLFWGTRTLLQLLSAGPEVRIRRVRIEDEPEYEYRGCMVDVARNFHSIDFHKRMVKNLARYKVNVYHIHFSDDQSYTLPSEKYPTLPTPDRHYTREQLDGLVKLAEEYHVAVVPEIDVPGHATSLCAAVPDLACCGKAPGGVICAGSEKSYAAIETLISETMDIFPGRYFHIGADEVNFAAWDGCADCQALIEKEKLPGNEGLYNYFINRMNGFVRGKGRRTVVWEGFKVGSQPKIDRNILVDQFENHYAMPDELIKAGYDIVNASWSPLYIVPSASTPPEMLAEWNALYFGKVPPPKPLTEMIKIEPTKRLKGVCICAWEMVESAAEPLLFGIGVPPEGYTKPGPRLPIVAERAWTGDRTSAEDLLERVRL